MEYLENEFLRIECSAQHGAAITKGEAKMNEQWVPFLYSDQSQSGKTNANGMYVLAPFSNRISKGGFEFEGVKHPVNRNVQAEPYPLHGNAWQSEWDLVSQSESQIFYRLDNASCPPFDYDAELKYSIQDNTLNCELKVTNRGSKPLPFGMGFHPWFYRHAGTEVYFEALGIWMEDEEHLPTKHLSLVEAANWSFNEFRAVPEHLINNAYTEWNGVATIVQPEDGLSIRVTGSDLLSYLILYSPEQSAEFLCLEPVSHPVDAHNQRSFPGLVTLSNGESISAEMSIRLSPIK
ncbi:aldose 1-epimerase [Vibrio penaeicida]|uniref:Aldose 1-epimerase n=1 Tax=Vibrio penaeicida TaxID=104609 RepID=A0AAV5NNW0_9VIBR|nr:aldose 1-epimerase [Vibrio penaeicida]GLQ72208.1 aldose 1-epimerase [Vibrio penaeicida]